MARNSLACERAVQFRLAGTAGLCYNTLFFFFAGTPLNARPGAAGSTKEMPSGTTPLDGCAGPPTWLDICASVRVSLRELVSFFLDEFQECRSDSTVLVRDDS